MYRNFILICITAALLLLTGCQAATPEADADDDSTVEYNGIYKKKSELSEDTLKWLEWYHSLPEEQQKALSMVPSEFLDPSIPVVLETEPPVPEITGEGALEQTRSRDEEPPAYLEALTQEELEETSELARYYFTEKTPEFEGVEQIEPASDSYPLYQNAGIEASYAPGNIIIYLVHTTRDIRDGNPMRSISIARKSKSDQWKVINSGF